MSPMYRLLMDRLALFGMVAALFVTAPGLRAQEVVVLEEDFEDELGAFYLSRAVEADVRVEDGVFSLTGQADDELRSVRAELGPPLVGRVSILVRRRADEGAYGGLYISSGTRNVHLSLSLSLITITSLRDLPWD